MQTSVLTSKLLKVIKTFLKILDQSRRNRTKQNQTNGKSDKRKRF
jgi:hypothetical protein